MKECLYTSSFRHHRCVAEFMNAYSAPSLVTFRIIEQHRIDIEGMIPLEAKKISEA